MFVHYRTKGIIIKKTDRGEADEFLTIYTKDFGKLEILGKAIKRMASKLRSAVDFFYLSEIEFIQGKNFKTLTDAVLVDKFLNLRKDVLKLRIAEKIAEILDNLIKGQEPDKKIWNLTSETFNALDSSDAPSSILNLQYWYFVWKLLADLGYKPELYNCSVCQNKLTPGTLYFSPSEGGIVCGYCFRKVKDKKQITPEAVKILRIIAKKEWAVVKRIKIDGATQKTLKDISNYYLESILEKNR